MTKRGIDEGKKNLPCAGSLPKVERVETSTGQNQGKDAFLNCVWNGNFEDLKISLGVSKIRMMTLGLWF